MSIKFNLIFYGNISTEVFILPLKMPEQLSNLHYQGAIFALLHMAGTASHCPAMALELKISIS